ncbi:hypothetical protein [Chryseobacterium shigense]|uniref:DUF8202 domain-containing protein n=1 Tax=Chryseobacterium shigense TaxID=297244 RepID=A0A841MVP6_9FLAO|nr:hypothetical protein [Chryseobacterium shigense]MBB6369046.1 hypothetical protein [Chryseobacterium shigense]
MRKTNILIWCIFCFFSSMIYAQTPGGVAGTTIEYWLSADQVQASLPADGSDITAWQDLSGNGRNFSNGEANPFFPKFNKSAMNFHSAVDFYFQDSDDGGPSDANNRRRKLIANANSLVPNTGRSYFVIWISKLDQGNSASEATVFGLNGDTSSGTTNGNQYGWNGSNGRLWHRTRATAYTHNSTAERNYGIGIAVLPNNSGTAQQQYLNALASSTSMPGRTLGTGTFPSVIGTSATDTGSDRYFFGEVMEIIVMSKTGTGNTLTADELKKINTHLAVKYGITLNASQTDYILSDGTSIYNSANAGYTAYNKDIFGIARDNASGLYQKQSASTDNPVLTVYLGSTIAETNAENTETMTDKNALMFGANGLSGNASYSHDVGTAFQNYTLQSNTDPVTGAITSERLSIIFNYKLRAQTTGQSSFTVNMKPGQGEWLLVSSDPTFAPANTRIYKITGGNVNNVVINNGDYVGFTSFIKAPAGVANGLKMWLNASKESTITLNGAGEVINWVDHAGYGTTFSKITSNSTAPLYMSCDEKMNFHPSVYFRQSAQYLSTRKGPFSVAAPDDYTIFTALNANFNTSNRIYFTSYGSLTRSLYPALGVREGATNLQGRARIYDSGGAGAVDGTAILFNGGATTAMAHTMKKNTYFRLYADSYMEQLNETSAGRGSRMNGPGTLGYGGSSDSRNLIGVIGEHIAYEGDLSDADRYKIDSYLGLKYGITTDRNKTSNTVNFDFVLSDGTIVWPGTSNSAYNNYHHNVASVVRDDVADLYNRQAKSTDLGAILHMGVGTSLGCNAQLTDIINDKSALTWGHNAQPVTTLSLAGNTAICGAFDSKINGRIWLVDNTNFNQSVLVRAAGGDFPYSGANWQVYMLVADSEAKFAANNWDEAIPMTFSNGGHQANYNFNDKKTYISFAAKQLPGACEACTFSGVKKLEFNTWTRGAMTKSYDLGDGFTANVNVTIESPATMRTNYPRASDYRSLREYRRGDITKKMTTKVTFSKSANAKFEIFEISRRTGRLDNVEVYGMCSGGKVYPKLSYTRTAARSSYTILADGKSVAKPMSSSYTSTRGRMQVEFDQAVEEIYIVHYGTGSTSGSGNMRIGIGAMKLSCPKALPPANEDGLIFTKEADTDVLLCNEVNFAYKVYNTNCAVKTVNFTDVLPAGMKWLGNSLSADQNNDAAVDAAPLYANGNTISLTGITVPGSGYVTIRGKAYFEDTAAAGLYDTGHASISYVSLGVNKTLQSCDTYAAGCAVTTVNALPTPNRPKPIVVNSYVTDKSCYDSEGVITVTLTVDNQNASAVSDAVVDFNYTDTFTLVANSLKINNNDFPAASLETTAGDISVDGFNLPAGVSTITFKLKAPIVASLIPVPDVLSIAYDLSTSGESDCQPLVISDNNDELNVPFCAYCTQNPSTAAGVKSSVGISTLKTQDVQAWMNGVKNGQIVIESKEKGFIITRTTRASIAQPVAGMIIYDTTSDANCISLYNGTAWKCIERKCNQ